MGLRKECTLAIQRYIELAVLQFAQVLLVGK